MSLLIAVLLIGCGKSEPAAETGDTDQVNPGPGDSGPEDTGRRDTGQEGETTIYALNRGEHEAGSPVALRGVVASSPVSAELRAFFIQEEDGGEHSGIRVILADGLDLPALAPGDLLDLSATLLDTGDGPRLELGAGDSLEVAGVGSLTPEPLDEPEDWGPWQGVLVQLADQVVQDCPDGDGAAALSAGLTLDDAFSGHNEPAWLTGFAAVTGPVDREGGAWTVYPRVDADLGGESNQASCVAVAQTARECQVTLEGLVATTPNDRIWGGFFAQDAGGGQYAGLLIYYTAVGWAGAPELLVEAGDVLTLTGFTTEYYGQSELLLAYASELQITGSATPVATALDALPFDWEPYEGALITLPDLTLTSAPDAYGSAETSWSDLWLDDLLYDWTKEYGEGDHFSQVTGPIYYTWDEYRLEPRGAEDLVP